MRSLRSCVFIPLSPSGAWKIASRRRVLLLPPWEPVLCSRIWGLVWQAEDCLGQDMYKDISSCRTSGQSWKWTSVPISYFAFFTLACLFLAVQEPQLGAWLCDSCWRESEGGENTWPEPPRSLQSGQRSKAYIHLHEFIRVAESRGILPGIYVELKHLKIPSSSFWRDDP